VSNHNNSIDVTLMAPLRAMNKETGEEMTFITCSTGVSEEFFLNHFKFEKRQKTRKVSNGDGTFETVQTKGFHLPQGKYGKTVLETVGQNALTEATELAEEDMSIFSQWFAYGWTVSETDGLVYIHFASNEYAPKSKPLATGKF